VGDIVSKINEWLEEDKLTLLEGWARDGLTYEQIAKNMGIGLTTLKEWRKKEPTISSVLKKGREVIDFEVENALLKKALGYTVTLNKQKVTKDGDVVDIQEDVYIAPDTTAQIFWLKNRKKEQWREKQEYNNDEELSKLDKLLEEQKNAYMDN
jgi:transcriptional regulator with XRE-family HTH domain